MINVSVIVPTFNRRSLLKQCLMHLCAQTLDPARFEVIVADDENSTETGALVLHLCAHFPDHRLRYCGVRQHHGPAAARNEGWRKAYGEIIAFTDDDCLPAPTWLEAALVALEGRDAVWGRVQVPLSPTPTDHEVNTAGLGRGEFVTANCFCRREMLERVDGFDERFARAWREDSDLYFTLLERNAVMAYAPDVEVTHPPRPGTFFPSMAQQKNNLYEALLSKKHPALYREHAVLPMIWYYSALILLAMAAFIGALAGHRDVASWLAWGWAAGTLMFAAYRIRHSSKKWRDVAEMLVTSICIPPLAVFWRLAGYIKFRHV